jgi:internalin A
MYDRDRPRARDRAEGRRRPAVALGSVAPGGLLLLGVACSPGEPGPGLLGDPDEIELCHGEIEVPDPALREALLAVVPQPDPPEDPPPDAPEPEPVILAEHLRTLRGLNAPGLDIADLRGLECAQGLLSLGLSGNAITDVEPLLDLTGLRQLELSNNEITDVTALGRLHRLTRLALPGNGIADISPLAGLSELEALDLAENEVGSLSALAGLEKLAVLVLSKNQVADLGPLAGLSALVGLEIDDNQVGSLDPLRRLTGLRYVDLDGNHIGSLEPLADAVGMQELEASRNELTSLAGVERMLGITRIVAQENQITTTAPVAALSALSVLDLGDNQLASLEGVGGLSDLQRLLIPLNRVTDLGPASGLPELRDLDVRYNEGLVDLDVVGTLPLLGFLAAGGYGQAQDLGGLAGRQVLRSLTYVDAVVVDLGFFAELPGLESITFTDTPLSPEDLGHIAQAATLQALLLDATGITDLSPLAPLTLVETLSAKDCGLPRVDTLAGWPNLRTARLSGNPLQSLEGVEWHELLSELDVSRTPLADLAPVVTNETFRRGDTLVAEETGLDEGDCGDVAVIRDREAVVQTDLECG